MVGIKEQLSWLTRHIPIRGHLLHQEVLDAEVSFVYVGTADQRADEMTKGLTKELHVIAMIPWAMTTTP